MKTNYNGLWKQERTGWYSSKAFTQEEIKQLPKKCKLVLRYNKFHKADEGNTPKFIFCFADAEGAESLCEVQETEEVEQADKLIEKLKEIHELSQGYSYYGSCGNCCSMQDHINDIRDIVYELLRERNVNVEW